MIEKGPIRTCIGCGNKFKKEELLRFVADNQGNILPDINKKLPGRGVSVCFEKECIFKAIKKNSFSRHFKKQIVNISIDELRNKTINSLYNYMFTIMRFAFGGNNIVSGQNNCIEEIIGNNIRLCLITEDISENSLKKIMPVINKYSINVKYILNKRETAIKLHKPIRTVYGIKDEVLSGKLVDILNKIEKVKTWIG